MFKDCTKNNSHSVASWNTNAPIWDKLMGEGSPFQQYIVDPSLEALLPKICLNLKILEIACGNGFLSRRLAKLGAKVWAFDASKDAIQLAKSRVQSNFKENQSKPHFFVFDAMSLEGYAQFGDSFDSVICNMAFMDIADLMPIFQGAYKVLKPNGSFIVTQTHPCFEKAVGPIFSEISDESENVNLAQTNGVKVSRYLSPSVAKARAVPELPEEHLCFHRPLSNIFNTAFHSGFVIDGFKEAAFPKDGALTEHNGWHLLTEVPVIMAVRFCKKN